MDDLDLLEFWNRFCGNMHDETGTLCYWNYFSGDISEEFLAQWEQAKEHAEFMMDWNEYIDE